MPRNPEAAIEIDAPLETVWQVMLDVDAYPEWNPFVVKAECNNPPRVGDPILLHVKWANGKGVNSPERIKVLEAPAGDSSGTTTATLAYVFEGWPAKLGLVKGIRYQRLRQVGGGPTTYSTVEEFSGPLVKLAGPARVAEGFARHARALKERAESRP
ncbi:hypothetical protein BJ980_001758 [Nocardioides daedukensis]|uniref:SRPBCC domain-containing protein n=1 Tax=Nocardioides daedukensis TaxID=634462 RepID=A0A7Y9S3M6_9ACTN|nr:SRPBCC domain-containing protein [Nocardioides daedukensis]NYG58835.1 hypothetical protein [Nocardioides daedukensis]